MFNRFALTLYLATAVVLGFRALRAEDVMPASATSTAPPARLIVLRNGEVLSGQVTSSGDRIVVTGNDFEVALASKDVDFSCASLDEAYRIQQSRLTGNRIEDHLNLAHWCMRHDLVGYAADQISAAMKIDPQNRRLVMLDRQLQLTIEEAAKPKTPSDAHLKPSLPASAEELDRMVKCLPAGTVETFTETIQPMLQNYCATAGCHGPSGSSKYSLLRPALGKTQLVRLTQRNLYNTLQFVDREKPADSKLLVAAGQPHGAASSVVAPTLDMTKYQELVAWVMQVGQVSKPIADAAPMLAPGLSSPRERGVLAAPYSPPGSLGSAVAPAAPINPRAVLSPTARIVPSSRPNAPQPKVQIPPSGAAPVIPLAGSPVVNTPVRPTLPVKPSANGDDIPDANQLPP